MYKSYVYRLYPTKAQEGWIVRNIGCCRFVYNQALGWRNAAYDADGTALTYGDTAYGLTKIKNVYPWLREADSASLQQALRHLNDAFKNFFLGNAKHPKFKSRKHSRRSYSTPQNKGSIAIGSSFIKLPKLGNVKAVIHRQIPSGYKVRSATVSIESDGAFYCSVLCDYEETVQAVQSPEMNAVGIDYKSDGLGCLSTGEILGSPKKTQANARKLARAQKKLSRKKGSRKGETQSNNYKEQKARVAKIHRYIANARKDDLHKKSASIAKRFDLVGVETLNMRAMSNHGFHLGKATMDNGYGMFLQMLEYKLHSLGKILIHVDKWFASSQKCSCCGSIDPEVKDLSVRQWVCPVCGAVHDRDINAAVNIRDEAIRIFKKQTA